MTLRNFSSTYAIPIGFGLGLLWTWARSRGTTRMAMPVDITDSRWSEAIAKARDTIPEMRALYEAGTRGLYIKYPLATKIGSIEHVWGGLLELSPTHTELDGKFIDACLDDPRK